MECFCKDLILKTLESGLPKSKRIEKKKKVEEIKEVFNEVKKKEGEK